MQFEEKEVLIITLNYNKQSFRTDVIYNFLHEKKLSKNHKMVVDLIFCRCINWQKITLEQSNCTKRILISIKRVQMRPDQMTDKAGLIFCSSNWIGCVRGYYRTLNRRERNRATNLQICYDRICLWGTKSLEPSNEILSRLHDVMT